MLVQSAPNTDLNVSVKNPIQILSDVLLHERHPFDVFTVVRKPSVVCKIILVPVVGLGIGPTIGDGLGQNRAAAGLPFDPFVLSCEQGGSRSIRSRSSALWRRSRGLVARHTMRV